MLRLKWISVENFKCFKSERFDFGKMTEVSGQNASGKTSIFDAFTFCFFGTNSNGDAKFDYKPFDRDGNPTHNLVTSVECGMEVDGKEIVLKRTMKENWVKKRGSEQAVFQGNVGSYEVDGYPRSEKEYKEIVNGIIDADIFKILTNPIHFASMPWKAQREILMSMLNGDSDAELAKKLGGYEELIPELEKAPSADAIREKYSKSLKELKATQKELPVRIDEVSKQITKVDIKALDANKAKTDEEIIKVESEIDKAKKYKELASDLRMKATQIESDMRHEVELANSQNFSKKAELNASIIEAKNRLSDIEQMTSRNKSSLESKKTMWQRASDEVEALKEQYKGEKAKVFTEPVYTASDICPTCGQMLPKDRIEAAKTAFQNGVDMQRKAFEESKASRLAMLADRGRSRAESRDAYKAEIEIILSEIKENDMLKESIAKRVEGLEAELKALPTEVATPNTERYTSLVSEKESVLKSIADAEAKSEPLPALEGELAGLRLVMEDIRRIYTSVNHNTELEARISELEAEQRDVSQKIMDCEKMLYLLESFTKDKMERISSEINSHFDGVNFRLFELQINGGLKETCECTVDGVPYASLNSGHRIVAGLQIIKALQKIYGQSAPIFLDNAESINEYNIPNMGDTQMILLRVTEDKDLKVEVTG